MSSRIVDINLGEYGLTKEDFRMLYYFCRRYPQQKQKLIDNYCLNACVTDGSKNSRSNTEVQAEIALKFRECCRMVEESAKEAAPDEAVYECLMKHVTEGVDVVNGAYDCRGKFYKVPIYRQGYRIVRRKFYFILAQKLGL